MLPAATHAPPSPVLRHVDRPRFDRVSGRLTGVVLVTTDTVTDNAHPRRQTAGRVSSQESIRTEDSRVGRFETHPLWPTSN